MWKNKKPKVDLTALYVASAEAQSDDPQRPVRRKLPPSAR